MESSYSSLTFTYTEAPLPCAATLLCAEPFWETENGNPGYSSQMPAWMNSGRAPRGEGLPMLRSAIFLLAVGLIVCMAAFAQFEAGSVVGSVKDPSGLAVANAVVEIRSVATNVARRTVTSATGDFDFVALQPGPYEIVAKQPGFKEAARKFELSVGQRLELNLAMEVG